MRRIIDLTHTLFDGLEGFPGNPDVEIKPFNQIDDGGYRVNTLYMDGHTGTHLDVPRHVFHDGQPLDELDLNKCIGPAFRISLVKKAGDEITIADLQPYENKIKDLKRIVIATGWSSKFGTGEFYQNYPGFTFDAASWLIDTGVVLVGIDMPSVHPGPEMGLQVHHIFLKAGIVVVEAIAAPEQIPFDEFELICLPLSIKGGDGSPARVVAIVD